MARIGAAGVCAGKPINQWLSLERVTAAEPTGAPLNLARRRAPAARLRYISAHMRAAIAAALLLSLGACKKDPPRGPIPDAKATAELDALWALAPEGALGGMVLSSRGLESLEWGAGMLQSAVASAPDLAEHKRRLDELLRKTLGTTALTRAELGLTKGGGAALFAVGEGGVLVLPVGDRAKFLGRVRGTQGPDGDRVGPLLCKPAQGRYVCADTAARIDSLGRGNLKRGYGKFGLHPGNTVQGNADVTRFLVEPHTGSVHCG